MKKEFVTKQDLAVAYFPYISRASARHKLCNLIHDDKPLFRKISEMGYKKEAKCFTPNQLEAIFERIGRPYN